MRSGHHQVHVGPAGAEQAHLVVEEAAAVQCQRAGLEADAGAVAGGHAGAAEFDVLDAHARGAHDQDGLALGVPAVGVQHGAGARAGESHAGLVDDAEGADVVARGNDHGLPGAGGAKD